MLKGTLRIVRSSAQWRELLEACGPWQPVYVLLPNDKMAVR